MPFDEIVANPSDLKHVVELLGCSDRLGMVILAGTRRGIGPGVLEGFTNGIRWFGPKVGTSGIPSCVCRRAVHGEAGRAGRSAGQRRCDG